MNETDQTDTTLEVPQAERPKNTLVKLNLLITILGLGTLGYLHFDSKSSHEETLAKTKATMKQEILLETKEGMATSQQLQSLAEKNSELEVKFGSYVAEISNLEAKIENLKAENATLRTKITEIQASTKKSKAPTKSAPTKVTKKIPQKKARR